MGDAEVARETGAPVVGGGKLMRWNRSGSGAWDGVSCELFYLAGVGGGGDSDADSGLRETEMCGGGTGGGCRDGAGFYADYE